MTTSPRTLQETTTNLSGEAVLARAKVFFATRPSLYATFLDKEGPGFCSFRGQGGEEIVIAVSAASAVNAVNAANDGQTRVTGSSYLFDMQVARFFSTLPPVKET